MSNSNDFVPIRTTTLRGDLKIPFDIYVRVAGKFILYCRAGESFEGKRLERLRAKKIRVMFVKNDDDIPYRQYLEASIDRAYKNSDNPIETRAEVIQGFQQAAAEEFFDEPTNEMTYKHAHSSIQRLYHFVNEQPKAAAALLKIKNDDASVSHHCLNVALLAMLLAKQNGVTEANIELLGLGCLLHDIDLIDRNIDLTIPKKDLPPETLQTYLGHPFEGAKRLQASPFIERQVLTIVLQHEENIKGTGFPNGLPGVQLDPLVIMAATANAYDQMVSFEKLEHKKAIVNLLMDKVGLYPLNYIKDLQSILKSLGVA